MRVVELPAEYHVHLTFSLRITPKAIAPLSSLLIMNLQKLSVKTACSVDFVFRNGVLLANRQN